MEIFITILAVFAILNGIYYIEKKRKETKEEIEDLKMRIDDLED
jgi:hypothetical protein